MNADNIWITRKCRIYAEKRLKYLDFFLNFFVIWYSFILVCFSIWSLINPEKSSDIFLVFGSIAVLVTSIIIGSQKFAVRAEIMKNCYIQLEIIYQKACRAQENKNASEIEQIEIDYSKALTSVENHIDFDYLNFQISVRKDKKCDVPKPTKGDWLRYISINITIICTIVFILGLPLILANWVIG